METCIVVGSIKISLPISESLSLNTIVTQAKLIACDQLWKSLICDLRFVYTKCRHMHEPFNIAQRFLIFKHSHAMYIVLRNLLAKLNWHIFSIHFPYVLAQPKRGKEKKRVALQAKAIQMVRGENGSDWSKMADMATQKNTLKQYSIAIVVKIIIFNS